MDKTNKIVNDNIEFSHTITNNPNPSRFNIHFHEECEIYYLISGKGMFHIEGVPYPLQPGDVLIMNNTESHYIDIDSNCTYERFIIHFKKDFVRRYDPSGMLLSVFENRNLGHNNYFPSNLFDNNIHSILINKMILGILDATVQPEFYFFAFLNELLIISNSQTPATPVFKNTLANNISNFILDNLSTPLNIDDICAKFFISKTHLCRLFKQEIGSTVWDYITTKRITLAKSLLEDNIPSTKVCSMCGYTDYSSFYRAFKKQYNISPTDITKNYSAL